MKLSLYTFSTLAKALTVAIPLFLGVSFASAQSITQSPDPDLDQPDIQELNESLNPVLTSDDQQDQYLKATVLSVPETTFPIVLGREIEFQVLEVEFTDGSLDGQTSDSVFNDYVPVRAGDTIYITQGFNPDLEREGFYVAEVERHYALVWIFAIFVLLYILVAGLRGLRSLIALAVSISAVWFVLLPALAAGYSPLVTGFAISAVILGLAIFITHGRSVVSIASYLGSMIAIVITIGFAQFAVHLARVTGTIGDEPGTLAVLYGGAIDLQGLLLAAMIIGILGVLDDVAVMQAAMVREFMQDKAKSSRDIFIQALRVGQEHAAALVNTLVLAYVAVSLPLLLIVLSPSYTAGLDLPLGMQLSNELFIAEAIRSIVGSFGLVLTIPLVTLLAIVLYKRFPQAAARAQHDHVHSHAGHHH